MPNETVKGYGMRWEQFCDLSFPDEPSDGKPTLEGRMKLVHADMMALEGWDFVSLGLKFTGNVILSRNTLRTEPETKDRHAPYGHASELYRLAGEGPELILFLPDMTFHKEWFRGSSAPIPHGRAIRRRDEGFLPFSHLYMDDAGQSLKEGDPGARPAIPLELRWWLLRLGILDNDGINQLWPFEVLPQDPP